jgi:LPXTG-motif cell wall-anchored protein
MFTIQPTRSSGVLRSAVIATISAVTLLLVLSVGMNRAGAQTSSTYPPETNPPPSTVVITPPGDDDRVVVGESLELYSDRWEPGTPVDFYVLIDGERVFLGTAIADENGVAIFDWTVPAGVCCGDFEIEIEGIDEETGEPRTAVGDVFIYEFGAGVPGEGGELPYTGSNSNTLVRIGLVLVLAGGVSVVAVRRRSARSLS